MSHEAGNQTIALNGLNFVYRDWGGSGPPIVLLHGLASNARIWDLVAPLLAREFRVVALNQRGHGGSAKPESDYSFGAVVGDVRVFVSALQVDRPLVVGHSWGGNVALAYGVDFPDEARGLVLLDGGTLELAARMDWAQAEVDLAPPPLAGTPLDVLKERLRGWIPEGMSLTPEIEAAVLANFRIEDGKIYPHLERDLHMKILRALWEQRPSQLYAQVTCPVLVLPSRREGHDDPEFSQNKALAVAQASERLPDAEVVWLEDTVHDAPLHRPELVARLVAGFAKRIR